MFIYNGALSTLVASVFLYSLTRATLMTPGKEETRAFGYIRSEFIHWALWRTLMRTKYFFCSFTTRQAFWQSSAPGVLGTLVTSFVLYSLTRATLMSPGKDETRVCGYINYIYIYNIYIYIYIYIYMDFLGVIMWNFQGQSKKMKTSRGVFKKVCPQPSMFVFFSRIAQ